MLFSLLRSDTKNTTGWCQVLPLQMAASEPTVIANKNYSCESSTNLSHPSAFEPLWEHQVYVNVKRHEA